LRNSRDEALVIEAGKTGLHYFRDIWSYRELFAFLAWRDILVHYKQTFIGIGWAVIRPLLTMVVFTLIFGRLANLPSGGVPYSALVFTGLLPWLLFANAFPAAGESLISSRSVISKIYFPRLIVPLSSVVVSLLDFSIGGILLLAMLGAQGIAPDWRILALPIVIIQLLALTVGAGLWIAALNVKYRDVRHVVPFLTQLGLYISPVGYSSAVVPESWRVLFSVNPMVGIIDGFRWALLPGQEGFPWMSYLMSSAVALTAVVSAVAFFRRTERYLVDTI